MKSIIKKSVQRIYVPYNVRKLKKRIQLGMPSEVKSAIEFLITGKIDGQTSAVIEKNESLRKSIADLGEQSIEILYSPKPGSAGDDPNKEESPEHGELKNFTMAQVANTGKNRRWGTALNLLSRDFKAHFAVELGTCAGISARYLASTPIMEKLITVEGSSPLSKLATEIVSDMPNIEVVNSLFDDAISNSLEEIRGKVDLAYIDGHHEKIATIRYFNRLLPYMADRGIVIFDDISWSQDMREGWEELAQREEFSHCFDLGAIGLGIVEKSRLDKKQRPAYWDLQGLVGPVKIGRPHGWRD